MLMRPAHVSGSIHENVTLSALIAYVAAGGTNVIAAHGYVTTPMCNLNGTLASVVYWVQLHTTLMAGEAVLQWHLETAL